MEPHFQQASITDLTLILSFMQQFYAIDQYSFDRQSASEAVKTLIEETSLGRLWLIIEDTQAIGYMALTFGYSLEFHGRDAMIDELFLMQAYRKQGIGTKALEFVSKECSSLGIHALHLEVEHTNEAGMALYRKLGFEAHEQRYLMTMRINK